MSTSSSARAAAISSRAASALIVLYAVWPRADGVRVGSGAEFAAAMHESSDAAVQSGFVLSWVRRSPDASICAASGLVKTLGIETPSSCLSILRFATGPKRSMGHLLGAEKINFFNSRY